MADSDAALLDYTIDPDHLDAEARDTGFTVTARNNTGGPVACTDILLRVPRGRGAGQLTTQDDQGVDLSVTDGWSSDAQAGTDHLDLSMSADDPDAVLPANGELGLTVGGLTVNGVTGTVLIEVRETVDDRPRTASLTLNKNPAGFVFRDFRPDPYMVDPDHQHTGLTWTAQAPAGVDATYTLTHSTEHGTPVSHDVTHCGGRWTLTPVADTACVLSALLTPQDTTIPTTTAALSTFVLVAGPAINAGRLSADGTVRLLGRQHTGGPVAGYTSHDWRSAGIDGDTFTAHTDGLLLATARSRFANTRLTFDLALRAQAGTDPVYALTLSAGVGARTTTLPVPAGHVVTVATGVPDPHPDLPWYVIVLDWQPWGGGRLVR
ncbi:hypothetical protein [Embleya sp. NPDC001921]